jgi:TIR domain
MAKKIFISFASKDRQTAMTICHALEARGQKCWISCRDIHPGENYQESIVHAIRGAGVMLLVFSANANNSDEIKKEIALASQSRLMVIPVRSEDVVPSEAFSYELATRQWVDLFSNWDEAMGELVAQLESINPSADPAGNAPAMPAVAAPPQAVAPAVVKPSVPAPRSKKHWWVITGLVLAALSVIVFVPMLSGLMVFAALIYGVIHYRNEAKAARGAA